MLFSRDVVCYLPGTGIINARRQNRKHGSGEQSDGKHRFIVDLKVKVKQMGHVDVEMAGTKSPSFATRRRIQEHPAGNPCVHKDTAWGDPQHAWRPHGSGVRAMSAGLGCLLDHAGEGERRRCLVGSSKSSLS